MHPPDGPLARLHFGAETLFRILPRPPFRPCRPQGTKADGIPTTLSEGNTCGNGRWRSRRNKFRILIVGRRDR